MNNSDIGECERCFEQRHLTKHRKVPGCRGGTYIPSNVMRVCRPCHEILDRELGLRLPSGRTGRYVACEKCGDVSEKIEIGLCRKCRRNAMGLPAEKTPGEKTEWLRGLHGLPEGAFSIGQIARWK